MNLWKHGLADVESFNISTGKNLEVMVYLLAVKMGLPPAIFFEMSVEEVEKLIMVLNTISKEKKDGK